MLGRGLQRGVVMGIQTPPRNWLLAAALVAAVALPACASGDDATPVPTATPMPTATPVPTATPTPTPPVAATVETVAATPTRTPAVTATVETVAATPAEALPAVEDTYVGVGASAATTVVVLAQGGPLPFLAPTHELTSRLGALDLEQVFLVNVHQAQTIDPGAFAVGDITFEEAVAASSRSVAMLAAVVEHFQDQGKTVYVVGISFGAFVVQELLATQGNVAEGYLIVTGRLDMPDGIWTEFAEGRRAGFARGVEIVKHTGAEGAQGGGGAAFYRNSARLAAGLGHHRYSERLAHVDMTNVVYVFAALDEQVGRLTDPELAFLAQRGAQVVEHDGGHGTPGPVMYDAFARLLPAELLEHPSNGAP